MTSFDSMHDVMLLCNASGVQYATLGQEMARVHIVKICVLARHLSG